MTENPAVEILRRERDAASAEIESLQESLKVHKATLKSLDEAISALTGAPLPTPPKRSSGPTLNDMVFDILPSDGMGTTPVELAGQLTADGRPTNNTTVSSLLSRLRKAGRAEKRGDRWFKASLNENEAPAREASEAEEAATSSDDSHEPFRVIG